MKSTQPQFALDLDLDIDRDFGNWFAGFVDGEGCFILQVSHLKDGSRICGARLSIGLRLDDLPILQEIETRLRCGHITYDKLRGYFRASWIVTRVGDLKFIIIPLLERCPLRAKKRRDFLVWKEGVEIVFRAKNSKRGRKPTQKSMNEEDWLQFNALETELKRVRKFIIKMSSDDK